MVPQCYMLLGLSVYGLSNTVRITTAHYTSCSVLFCSLKQKIGKCCVSVFMVSSSMVT